MKPGDLFFALKGNNFNGNLFAKQALEAGAAYAIIDDKDRIDTGTATSELPFARLKLISKEPSTMSPINSGYLSNLLPR